MGAIYQLTFFLALAMLAILITIFVFAVSLLGRAMEAAAKSEKEKLFERKENNAKAMADIKKKIDEAEGQIPKGLTKQLEKLEKRDREFDRELAKIRKAPELLTVKGGVVPPALSLLGALILSGVAWGLSGMQNFVHITLWILGLAAIAYSISRIYKSLKVIESVAITSEETALKRTIEAFKIAQKELEEEKRPELKLEFSDAQPPFHMEADSEILIKSRVRISHGDIARKIVLFFSAPPGFGFPDSPEAAPPLSKEYANYVSTSIEIEDLTKGMYRLSEVKLKAPSQPEHYNLFYSLCCEGFFSEFKEFEVVVKESKDSA